LVKEKLLVSSTVLYETESNKAFVVTKLSPLYIPAISVMAKGVGGISGTITTGSYALMHEDKTKTVNII
jgi:hypothetical protein